MGATWTRALSDARLQEVRVGYSHFDWKNLPAVPSLATTPNYVLPGLTIGPRRNYPQEFFQNTISARYDLTWTRGSHDWKIGAEYLHWKTTGQWQLLARGEYVFTSAPADLARRFPADAWSDPTRWDLTGLDGFVQRYDLNVGDWTIDIPRPTVALWIGDTWKVGSDLTLNYGVRWDADWRALDPPLVTTGMTFNPVGGAPLADVALGPGDRLYPGGLRDINNIAPRAGLTWAVGGARHAVIRGGSGLYFSTPDANTAFSQQSFNSERILVNSFSYDGRPGFVGDPRRGRTPEDILSGRVPLPPQSPRVIAHDYRMPYTWQSTLGFQAQVAEVWGLEADLTHWEGYNFARQRDPNLFVDPATGYNRNPAIFGRPDPKFTRIQWLDSSGHADYAALSSGLTRRYRDNWQAGVTYTLMLFMRDDTNLFFYEGDNPFDPDADWARSLDFQRHTLRMNGIWRLPHDVTLSGAYFFGSGNYYATTIAANPFGHTGLTRYVDAAVAIPTAVQDRFEGASGYARGTVIPRNALRGDRLHRVDVRASKDIALPRGLKVTAIAEVFNLFNHRNIGAYNGLVGSATFGEPRQNLLSAYQPRVGQLAFKVSF